MCFAPNDNNILTGQPLGGPWDHDHPSILGDIYDDKIPSLGQVWLETVFPTLPSRTLSIPFTLLTPFKDIE